jgi:hypothetical protein
MLDPLTYDAAVEVFGSSPDFLKAMGVQSADELLDADIIRHWEKRGVTVGTLERFVAHATSSKSHVPSVVHKPRAWLRRSMVDFSGSRATATAQVQVPAPPPPPPRLPTTPPVRMQIRDVVDADGMPLYLARSGAWLPEGAIPIRADDVRAKATARGITADVCRNKLAIGMQTARVTLASASFESVRIEAEFAKGFVGIAVAGDDLSPAYHSGQCTARVLAHLAASSQDPGADSMLVTKWIEMIGQWTIYDGMAWALGA